MSGIKQISSDRVPPASGGYSQALVAGDVAYLSGQGPFDEQGKLVGEGDFEAQTRQVFKNLATMAEAAGGSLDSIVRTTVYLRDFDDFDQFDLLYREIFSEPYPARTTIEAGIGEIEIEADAVVWLGDGS